MPLAMFALLLLLGTIAIVLLLWYWLRRWARFSLRSLVLFVMSIAAAGALLHKDLSEERVLSEHGHTLKSAVAADGSRAAIEQSSIVEVWDTRTGNRTHSVHTSVCHRLGFSPSGDLLVIGGLADVRVVNLKDQSIRTVPEPAKGFGVFSPSEQVLATGSDDKVCLWRWPDLAPMGSLDEGLGSLFRKAVWSPDGTRLAVSGVSNELKNESSSRVWDIKSGRVLYEFTGTAPCFSADGRTLASLRTNWIETAPNRFSFRDVTLMLWDASSGVLRKEWTSAMAGHVAAFSRESDLLLTGGGGSLNAWDLNTGQCTATFEWRRASTIGGNALGVSSMVDLPDRQGLLCLSDWDPRLYRWDYRSPWASRPFLGYVEFWVLAVLGLGLLVSLVQDLRHFRKARKEMEAARSAS